MSSIKPINERYYGATFGPFFRGFFLLIGLVFLGFITGFGFTEFASMTVRLVFFAIGVAVLLTVLICFVCNYTEIDSEHIINFFRLGPMRLELLSARWDDVHHAEYGTVQLHWSGNIAELKLFKFGGKKVVFNASAAGRCAERFRAIARHFPEKAPEPMAK
jgi:hypothetical protein